MDPTIFATLEALFPPKYAMLLPAIFGVCAFAVAFWHRPADGSKWLPIYNFINMLGQNYRQATNATAIGATSTSAPTVILPNPPTKGPTP